MKNRLALLRVDGALGLVLGNMANRVGYSSTIIVLGLLILEKSGSGFQVGLLDLTLVLPMAVLSPLAGLIIDRLHPRRILVACGPISALLLLLLIPGINHTFLALSVSAGIAIVATFFTPAVFSLTPELIPQEDLLSMNSLMELFSIGAVAITGGVIGWIMQEIGVEWALISCMAAFLVSALCFRTTPRTTISDAKPGRSHSSIHLLVRNYVREMLDGFHCISNLKNLRLWISMFFVISLADALVYPFLVVWAKQVHGLADLEYGLVQSAMAIGSTIGILVVAPMVGSRKPTRMLILLLVAIGVSLTLLAFRIALPITLLILAGFSISRSSMGLMISTEVQKLAPEGIRGRVMGAYQSIGEISYTLTVALASLFVDQVGANILILVSGILMLLVSGSIWVRAKANEGLQEAAIVE